MNTKISESNIELSSAGELLHFSHANGYPPLSYTKFLKPFQENYRVSASLHRPLWESKPSPESISSWQVFGHDVATTLKRYDEQAISIGHSMGAAASVIAASANPKLIKRLVLVEPALVPPSYYMALKLFRPLIKVQVPLIKRTLNRVDTWDNVEQAYGHFRPKAIFRGIADDVLRDYVNNGTAAGDSGQVHLVYSKQWEAKCYLTAYNIWPQLQSLSIPVLVIRGANSNTFSAQTYQRLQKRCPDFDYLEFPDSGHLLPLERPRQLSEAIQSWL